jgi:hypothetical protein
VVPHITDDQPVDDEVAFWRGFITWWAQEKSEPVPARAWQALERAQSRAELAKDTDTNRAGGQ